MLKNIKNILFISTGGGIGDALNCIPIFNYLNRNLNPEKIFYYSTDLENFWFENKLFEYKPKNLIIIKSFPQHFGTKFNQIFLSKDLVKFFGLKYFDLIIDNQTVLKNTIIYKKIPHKYYVSPCLKYFFSKPYLTFKKIKNINLRIVNYLNKLLNKNDNLNYNVNIPDLFNEEAKRIMKNKKKYIGFSITQGHPSRNKEIKLNEIIKLANQYSDKFIPTFFIEKKFINLKSILKKEVKNSFFPEEFVTENLQKPMIVTALGSLTEFNISIDNGISHMLSFASKRIFIFYDKKSEKFRPHKPDTFIFDCEKQNKKINDLTSKEILEFINSH